MSGGAYGVSDLDGFSCVVQFPKGSTSRYTTTTQDEYEVCKAEVQAVLDESGLESCQTFPR